MGSTSPTPTISTVSLTVDDTTYPKLQIWGDTPKIPNIEFVAYVHHQRIPLFLVSMGPCAVYTELSSTEQYFARNLMAHRANIGILTRFAPSEGSSNEFVVFYFENGAVKCFGIDFGVLAQTKSLADSVDPETNIYFDDKVRTVPVPDTTVFDRVLEGKLTKKTPVARNISHEAPLLVLSTSAQISQAVNKTILSGLRLRGLSRSAASSKERVAVAEIYNMAKKAAHFALRKYNYDFNANAPTKTSVTEVQDIVERLLEIFVDVGAPGNFT